MIEEHDRAASPEGLVVVGKQGRRLAADRRLALQKQIDAGHLTRLYLVFRTANKEFEGFQARLREILELPPQPPIARPVYYGDLEEEPSTYFIVHTPFEPTSLEGLIITSSSKPLLPTMARCSTSLFTVQDH